MSLSGRFGSSCRLMGLERSPTAPRPGLRTSFLGLNIPFFPAFEGWPSGSRRDSHSRPVTAQVRTQSRFAPSHDGDSRPTPRRIHSKLSRPAAYPLDRHPYRGAGPAWSCVTSALRRFDGLRLHMPMHRKSVGSGLHPAGPRTILRKIALLSARSTAATSEWRAAPDLHRRPSWHHLDALYQY